MRKEEEGERLIGDVGPLQEGIEDPVGSENRSPGEGAHQVGAPEREDDQHQQQLAMPGHLASEEIGDRKSEDDVDEGHDGGDRDRAEQHAGIEIVGDDGAKVFEGELTHHRQVVDRPECVDQQDDQRDQVEDQHPDDRRRKQRQSARQLSRASRSKRFSVPGPC